MGKSKFSWLTGSYESRTISPISMFFGLTNVNEKKGTEAQLIAYIMLKPMKYRQWDF